MFACLRSWLTFLCLTDMITIDMSGDWRWVGLVLKLDGDLKIALTTSIEMGSARLGFSMPFKFIKYTEVALD